MEKPAQTDYYDVDVFNANADIIDGALHTLQDEVDGIGTHITATLTAAGWSGSAPYTQTVTATGVTATMRPIVDVVLSDTPSTAMDELNAWALVGRIDTGADSITVTCYEEAPAVDLDIVIKVV